VPPEADLCPADPAKELRLMLRTLKEPGTGDGITGKLVAGDGDTESTGGWGCGR
jgi:hypothetical protein